VSPTVITVVGFRTPRYVLANNLYRLAEAFGGIRRCIGDWRYGAAAVFEVKEILCSQRRYILRRGGI